MTNKVKNIQSPFVWFFAFLLLLNAALRAWGIWFPVWAFDENHILGKSIHFLENIPLLLRGDWQQLHTVADEYGIVGQYIALLPVALAHALEHFFGISYPIPLKLIAVRVFVSLLPNVLSIYFLLKIIRLHFEERWWQLLALLLCLGVFKHIETAHYGVADSLSTLFAVWAVYLLARRFIAVADLLSPQHRDWAMLGVLAALASSSKIHVGFVIVATFLAVAVFYTLQKQLTPKTLLLITAKIIGWGVAAFVFLNIPFLIDYRNWLYALLEVTLNYAHLIKGSWIAYFYFYPVFGVDWGILLLAIAGILAALRNKKNTLLPYFVFIVLYYALLCLHKGAAHRWAIPLAPFFIVFALYALYVLRHLLVGRLRLPLSFARYLLLSIAIVAVVRPLYHIVLYDINITATPSTYQQLQSYYQTQVLPHPALGKFMGIELPPIQTKADPDTLSLQHYDYAIFDDFWFLTRRYPETMIYTNTLHKRVGNWEPLRRRIEQEWHLVKKIKPRYYTFWSNETANPPIFYIYKKNTLPSE
ncbi:MAG: hypothetical protein IPL35_10410 [Sphingobacteriales bacterium]|nr:hypothetical protein [Sphingobacteriales bacterium]